MITIASEGTYGGNKEKCPGSGLNSPQKSRRDTRDQEQTCAKRHDTLRHSGPSKWGLAIFLTEMPLWRGVFLYLVATQEAIQHSLLRIRGGIRRPTQWLPYCLLMLVLIAIFSESQRAFRETKRSDQDLYQTIAKDFILPKILDASDHRKIVDSSFYSQRANQLYHPTAGPWQALGNRLLIVNVENRPMTNVSAGSDPFELPFWSTTSYYNFLYAKRHGYQYKRISAPEIKDRFISWAKVSQVFDLLNDHEFVLLLDCDAYITNLTMPFEWLMNRWGFQNSSIMMMTPDPPIPVNIDSHGDVNLNTGFMLLRRDIKTFQMLYDLYNCPDRVPDCDKWKFTAFCDQTAFSDHVKAKMQIGTELVVVPCTEANGYEGHDMCNGFFVTHAWTAKAKVSRWMLESIWSLVLQALSIPAESNFGRSDSSLSELVISRAHSVKLSQIHVRRIDSTLLAACVLALDHQMKEEAGQVYLHQKTSELHELIESRRRAGTVHPMLNAMLKSIDENG